LEKAVVGIMRSLFYVPTRPEEEVRRRIQLSVAAYQYEMHSTGLPVMTDAQFDAECLKVDLSVNTQRPDLDSWWIANFQAYTGSWIASHPELTKIEEIYREHYNQAG